MALIKENANKTRESREERQVLDRRYHSRMGKRAGILSLDAFAKTVEDARVKTASGGFITLGCIVTLITLIFSEWRNFNEIELKPELVVDRDRAHKLDINLDITFPDLPCDIMSLDIMDVSGETQLDVASYGFKKIRLDPSGAEIESVELKLNSGEGGATNVPDDYCGPCYGSKDQSQNEGKPLSEQVCCNDCDSVRRAYASQGWAFYDGKNVEQCEREGYVSKIQDRLAEGCRVIGSAKLNRINGNLHFAPGASFSSGNRHVHDLSLYQKTGDFSFRHTVNHFSFGPDVESLKSTTSTQELSSHPLDGIVSQPGGKDHLYSYFLKVVPTRYEFLNGKVTETNQFSSTYHDRPLVGGKDEDHPNTLHARGGIPGLFFHFDVSALKVINKEAYATTWSGFLLNVISAIGGILTVGAVLDRTVYEADKAIRGKKDK